MAGGFDGGARGCEVRQAGGLGLDGGKRRGGFLRFGGELVALGLGGGEFCAGALGFRREADGFGAGAIKVLFGGATGVAGGLFCGAGGFFGGFGGLALGFGGFRRRARGGEVFGKGAEAVALGEADGGLGGGAGADGETVPAPERACAGDQNLAGGEVALQDVTVGVFGQEQDVAEGAGECCGPRDQVGEGF